MLRAVVLEKNQNSWLRYYKLHFPVKYRNTRARAVEQCGITRLPVFILKAYIKYCITKLCKAYVAT